MLFILYKLILCSINTKDLHPKIIEYSTFLEIFYFLKNSQLFERFSVRETAEYLEYQLVQDE